MSRVPIVIKPVSNLEELSWSLQLNRQLLYKKLKKAEEEVKEIVERVMEEGDRALRYYTKKFDGCDIRKWLIEERELQNSWEEMDKSFQETIGEIEKNVRSFHQKQKPFSWWEERSASFLGERWRPLNSVACYIPGGRFPYPSSLLMTVVPAQIAGVKEIIVLTPPDAQGKVKKEILATAFFLGVKKVYRVGGAQAIAGISFGTSSLPAVDKIVGPGNIYVTAAKKLLQGIVGIDSLAGPSEVVIVADKTSSPHWLALDLLAQAEHDPLSLSILLSPDEGILLETKRYLERELQNQPLSFSRETPIYLYQIESKEKVWEVVNFLAPEHLQIVTENPEKDCLKVKNAGALFLGPQAPVALGDYGYGPNHVLPTGRGAVFSSPLSVRDFGKFSSFIYPQDDQTLQWERFSRLAEIEGLYYHRRSLLARGGREWPL